MTYAADPPIEYPHKDNCPAWDWKECDCRDEPDIYDIGEAKWEREEGR